MKDSAISKKRNKIEVKLISLEQELKALQQECPHIHATAKMGHNTGNWSSADDTYWVVVTCPECGDRKTYYSDDTENYKYWVRKSREKR